MRRQIYLHIGFPKTGTTSIQTWLTEHAPALAAHGVLYPAHGRDGQEYQYGHHRLARSLVERPMSELTVTWEMAIREAFNFYLVSDGYSRALGMPLTLDRNFLDFGVGWGRFPRIFWKDVRASNLYGCDVDPDALALCRKTGVPGTFDRLYPRGRLPYLDRHFDGGIAYSVFTHLSEDAHTHWMCELARVMRPGAVFCMTLEPRRFAEFIEQIPDKPLTDWHIGLRHASPCIGVWRCHRAARLHRARMGPCVRATRVYR